MTPDEFSRPMGRLINRFGKRNFDEEFSRLIWRAVCNADEAWLHKLVDGFIGNRRANNPPLLSDFVDAVNKAEHEGFKREVNGAAAAMKAGWVDDHRTPAERKDHVLEILSKELGPVRSVSEALEVAKLRIRLAEADQDA